MRTLQIILCYLFLFTSLVTFSQSSSDNSQSTPPKKRKTVGLVLSGGGAKGIAHITVIKVLEEYGIPIDYITGTSMGAIVGGFYAAGYTSDELELFIRDPLFQDWISGKVNIEDQFYFGRQERGAEWVNFNIEYDSIYGLSWDPTMIPTGLLNYNLSARLYKRSKEINYDFDSLDIPFRAVVSDIFERKAIAVGKGELMNAIRGSMAVPLIFSPVKIDDKYVYDGGIYNNIPVDIMKEEFNPDMVIAVNLGAHDMFEEYPYDRDEELVKGNVLKFIVMNNVYPKDLDDKKDIYLGVPVDEYSAADFTPVDSLLAIGDRFARTMIDSVVKVYGEDQPKVKPRPSRFNSLFDPDEKVISHVDLGDNLSFGQRLFVRNIVKPNRRKKASMDDLYNGYSMLLSNNYFNNLDAYFYYDSLDEDPKLHIDVFPNKKVRLGVGGNIASRNIGQFYINTQFNVFTRSLNTVSLNAMGGSFYNSVKFEVESLYAKQLPFSLGAEFIHNRWNYANASELIFEKRNSLNVLRKDNYFGGKISTAMGRKFKFTGFGGYFWNNDNYDQVYLVDVDSSGTQVSANLIGHDKHNGLTTGLLWESNTLNRKQFADEGRHVKVSGKYIWSENIYDIFFTQKTSANEDRNWYTLQAQYEEYFNLKFLTLGVRGHATWSNYEASFSTPSTLANSPIYYPLVDSKTIFNSSFRGPRFFAGGIKLIKSLFTPNFKLSLEGHAFTTDTRYSSDKNEIIPNVKKYTFFSKETMDYASSAALIYHSPIGPLSISASHYSEDDFNLLFLFNIGIIMHNKRILEE
ncbi:patatin-like phospholipase family protein [Flammeovirga pacifica]|uniref:PNPLA domain-containing protein n=1 Tax=Flammeovirga pacifica TaxID=915059 RepID=A0A1S1Z462_FLAPC|nr:patatin-like phospholipase family protein [Flammeovirga pacifica]OHX68079.1 hypothetical protein NH26_17875 [Flammeovirga pacifica]